MRALVCRVGQAPVVEEVDPGLKASQKIVGGYIESVCLSDDGVYLTCNEEGKIHGLPSNRPLMTEDGQVVDIIAGNFLVHRVDREGESCSLTDADIALYSRKFSVLIFEVPLGS